MKGQAAHKKLKLISYKQACRFAGSEYLCTYTYFYLQNIYIFNLNCLQTVKESHLKLYLHFTAMIINYVVKLRLTNSRIVILLKRSVLRGDFTVKVSMLVCSEIMQKMYLIFALL